MRAISQEMLKISILDMSLTTTNLRLQPHLPGTNELNSDLYMSYVCCMQCHTILDGVNTLRPRQNGRHFTDDTFRLIFLNENVKISTKISLQFVSKGPINNIPALVLIMAWHRSGDKPLSESVVVSLLTHICVTLPQWVKSYLSITCPGSNKCT